MRTLSRILIPLLAALAFGGPVCAQRNATQAANDFIALEQQKSTITKNVLRGMSLDSRQQKMIRDMDKGMDPKRTKLLNDYRRNEKSRFSDAKQLLALDKNYRNGLNSVLGKSKAETFAKSYDDQLQTWCKARGIDPDFSG